MIMNIKKNTTPFIIPIFSKRNMESINEELAHVKSGIEFGLQNQ